MTFFPHKIFIFLLLSCGMLSADYSTLYNHFFRKEPTSLGIKNWKKPTKEDYWKIQDLIESNFRHAVATPLKDRPFDTLYLRYNFYGSLTYRMGRLKLISKDKDPIRCHDFLGNDPKQRRMCVITYAGYSKQGSPQRDYSVGIKWIKKSLKHFGFKGHLLYYVGGWPGAKRERLKWADVPYAFKPFLFEEARDLGYKNVLWIDTSVLPVKSLMPIFRHIEKKGLCFMGSDEVMPWNEMNRGFLTILKHLNLSDHRDYHVLTSETVGMNFKNQKVNRLLDDWIKAAEMKVPFLQSDQPPFHFLVNVHNLFNRKLKPYTTVRTPCNTLKLKYWETDARAILYHQYDLIHPNVRLPHDIFNH